MAPWYISIGMTYEQYWDGEPEMCIDYRHAHEYKQIEQNHFMWVQGAYFYEALGTALGNAFRGRGKPALNYLEEPYSINNRMKKARKEEKEKMAMARILGMMKRSVRNQKKSKGNGE